MANVRAAGGGRKKGKSKELVAVADERITHINPPDELRDDNAVEMWKTSAEILIQRQVLTLADAAMLLVYCNSFSLYLEAEQTVLLDGLTVSSAQGGAKKHPAVNVRQDAISAMMRAGSLLGLDPLSRSRVNGGGGSGSGDDANEFDRF
ncbi:phage terminase small subunit P27 family [Photobacterium leiognathi]|uniref:phage terminase small subunit P27 family n=1 Tax=Photobacterium leiognathi TaxID=553611 RepID=UPI001C6329FF|nr:phage terminase small subunit P27 family [Photobacterium leiognathi]